MQGTKEFCGKCIAVPLVKLAVETYSPPDFPPKLQWYKFQSRKDCTGSALAAFELIEVSYIDFFLETNIVYAVFHTAGASAFPFFVAIYCYLMFLTFTFRYYDNTHVMLTRTISGQMYACTIPQTENKEMLDVPLNTPVEDKIYSIPPDIRPKMASYRLEVIFWGVRDMRKINYIPVRRPRVVVECAGIHVKSEVMKNAKRFSNFEEPHIIIELVISRNYLENI